MKYPAGFFRRERRGTDFLHDTKRGGFAYSPNIDRNQDRRPRMKKSRKLIVDKKYQFGFAAPLTAASGAVITLVIVAIAAVSLVNNGKLHELASNQMRLVANQNDIYQTLLAVSQAKDLSNPSVVEEFVNRDVARNKVRLDDNTAIIIGIGRNNLILISGLIVFALLQSGILFYLLIKRSHRISGPVLVLNRYIDDIKNGTFPDVRPLREKDDLKELFENFRQMVEALKRKGGG